MDKSFLVTAMVLSSLIIGLIIFIYMMIKTIFDNKGIVKYLVAILFIFSLIAMGIELFILTIIFFL